MSDQPASEILTSRVLDYAGMGFLFVPPEVLVLEVAMNKDPINWPLVIASFLGCYIVGIFLLTVGLKWEKIKPKLSENLASSVGRVASSGVTWAFTLIIVAFGPVALVYIFSTSPTNSISPVSQPTDATRPSSQQSAEDQKQIAALQTDVLTATNAKEAIQRDLEASKQQAASLKSQLDVKTRELDAAQQVDLLPWGQQRNLIISLIHVFNDLRDQQSTLESVAHELSIERNKQGTPDIRSFYIPPCRIIVSSTKDNEIFAKLLETIAQSQGCE